MAKFVTRPTTSPHPAWNDHLDSSPPFLMGQGPELGVRVYDNSAMMYDSNTTRPTTSPEPQGGSIQDASAYTREQIKRGSSMRTKVFALNQLGNIPGKKVQSSLARRPDSGKRLRPLAVEGAPTGEEKKQAPTLVRRQTMPEVKTKDVTVIAREHSILKDQMKIRKLESENKKLKAQLADKTEECNQLRGKYDLKMLAMQLQ
eukprot:gene11355-3393_t